MPTRERHRHTHTNTHAARVPQASRPGAIEDFGHAISNWCDPSFRTWLAYGHFDYVGVPWKSRNCKPVTRANKSTTHTFKFETLIHTLRNDIKICDDASDAQRRDPRPGAQNWRRSPEVVSWAP